MAQIPEEILRRSFGTLLSFVLSRGIPFDDAQDLVQETMVSALGKYDPVKGSYIAYCTAALHNRVVNYRRDRRSTVPAEEIDIPDEAPPAEIETEEEHARRKAMIDRIRNVLTPEESEFLNAVGKTFIEMDSRVISEAARSLNMTPQKGTDVWRRIQRKAKKLYPALEPDIILPSAPRLANVKTTGTSPRIDLKLEASRSVADQPPIFAQRPPRFDMARTRMSPARDSLLGIARVAAMDAGYARLLGQLTGEQLKKLLSLVSRS